MKEVIDDNFLPHEAAMIQAIPLSLTDCVDKIFWPHSPDGNYSVRSGYRLLMEEGLQGGTSASDMAPTKRLRKGVWSLRIPSRVKNVLWRAGPDSLPSKANLKKRRIVDDNLCPGCKLKSEPTCHALWSCTALSPVWDVKFAWLRKLTSNCESMVEVIQLC